MSPNNNFVPGFGGSLSGDGTNPTPAPKPEDASTTLVITISKAEYDKLVKNNKVPEGMEVVSIKEYARLTKQDTKWWVRLGKQVANWFFTTLQQGIGICLGAGLIWGFSIYFKGGLTHWIEGIVTESLQKQGENKNS